MMKKITVASFLALVLIGCSGGDVEPVDPIDPVEYVPYDAPPISDARKQEFLDAVNNARAVEQDCGVYGDMPAVGALVWDDRLYRAAYEHSYDMATANQYTGHSGTGTEHDWTAQVLNLGRGSTKTERAQNNGFYDMGENVSGGRDDLKTAINAWLASDGHCHNLMIEGYTMLGMALVENSESRYKEYWTQTFF